MRSTFLNPTSRLTIIYNNSCTPHSFLSLGKRYLSSKTHGRGEKLSSLFFAVSEKTKTFFPYALTCSRRGYETNTANTSSSSSSTSTSSSTDGSSDKNTVEEHHPAQDVSVLEKLDMFAKSRMLNYLTRYTDPQDDSNRRASPFSVTKTADKSFFQAELLVPVEVLFSGVMQQTKLRAVGYGKMEKDAIVAACMHGERCLDALGIPLFTSERLQRKRVEEAKREGRYAPMPGDPVRDLSLSDLPFPVLYKPMDTDETTNIMNKGVSGSSSSSSSSVGNGNAKTKSLRNPGGTRSYPVLQSYQPDYYTKKRRYNDFSRRCGGDPFLRGMAGELAYLQARIFKHNTQFPGMEEGDDENIPIKIDPMEVEVLQPKGTLSDTTTTTTTISTSMESIPFAQHCPAMRLALINSHPLNEHRIVGFIDESEGGVYDLVEGEKGTWWQHDKLPGLVCLFDHFAIQRVDELYKSSHLQASFEACVETRASEELTQVDVGFGPHCQKNITWYTATAPIPSYPDLQATGKAMNITHAMALCAMHAELLLCFLGIPLTHNVEQQTKHFDACLRFGRLVSPLPRTLDDATRALLPKPLKHWPRIKKTRKRGAPLSLAEKLVALNRRVIADLRQHLVEVNICNEPQYRELFEFSQLMLRQFMVEQQHPYESAFVNYIYGENQFRCSIYLPLPERYGVRGGNAIGATPDTARELCALHAIDTLCALNIPVTKNKEKLKHLLDLRRRFGLILPRDSMDSDENSNNNNSSLTIIRSPPGYREVPGTGTTRIPPHQDVWNVMMADAGDFDVVKDVEPEKCYKLGLPDTGTLLRSLFQTYLQTVGWTSSDHWAHIKHYQGLQHWNGRLRVPCNNYWMELPVNEKLYGRRVALGRCVFRKTAEKAFFIHVFRILHTLRLAPWDMYSDDALIKLLRFSPKIDIQRERRYWDFVVREFLKPEEDTSTEKSGTTVVRDAEVMIPQGADLKAILSPNPVMTHELAKRTFV
ncbi:uncharacterized protein TM35_000112340 [Trypanosoma theileri]|uniref:REH2 DRSM domain-containing protein n=1 Tax=Trypanosoma theileri TaxID=67003 RepID=A0A1X0NZW9_9TRYP|nr:uncharacterized protein TM35_000112340 [Trypanosoma theileri]ORC89700.1 hypothetical protein TM35_000112340 [Trypanosoma theileri]